MDIKHDIDFDGPMKYSKGYKYQIKEPLKAFIPSLKEYGDIRYGFIILTSGLLELVPGFAWDGASGPTIDTKSSMRAGAVHDALYRLIRQELLPDSAKELADELLHDICVMDGMWRWRAASWYRAVDKFADSAADPKNKIKIKSAP